MRPKTALPGSLQYVRTSDTVFTLYQPLAHAEGVGVVAEEVLLWIFALHRGLPASGRRRGRRGGLRGLLLLSRGRSRIGAVVLGHELWNHSQMKSAQGKGGGFPYIHC